MSLSILYATVNGNTKRLAMKIAAILHDKGVSTELYDVENIKTYQDLPTGNILYCTSTYGSGQHPQSARALMASLYQLHKERQTRLPFRKKPRVPDLGANRRIAVLGLGSLTYPQFCAASYNAANLFKQNNIPSLVDSIHMDTVEVEARLPSWLAKLLSAIGVKSPAHALAPCISIKRIDTGSSSVKDTARDNLAERGDGASFLSAKQLTNMGWLYTLNVPRSLASVLIPGSHLAILPSINDSITHSLFSANMFTLNDELINPHTLIQVIAPPELNYPAKPLSAIKLLGSVANLLAKPSYAFISLLSHYVHSDSDNFKLKYLIEDENLFDILSYQWPTIHEFLLDFNSLRIPLSKFLEICPQITPRLYSAASLPQPISTLKDRYAVDILVGNPKPRNGYTLKNSLCPPYLREVFLSDKNLHVQASPSSILPSSQTNNIFNGKTPLIGVAFGSGLAPFRAYHELRSKTAKEDGVCVLAPYLLILSIQHNEPELVDELKTQVQDGVINVMLCLTQDSDEIAESRKDLFGPSSFISKHGTFMQVYRGKRVDAAIQKASIPQFFLESLNQKDTHAYYCGPANDAVGSFMKVIEEILGKERCGIMQNEDKMHTEAY